LGVRAADVIKKDPKRGKERCAGGKESNEEGKPLFIRGQEVRANAGNTGKKRELFSGDFSR